MSSPKSEADETKPSSPRKSFLTREIHPAFRYGSAVAGLGFLLGLMLGSVVAPQAPDYVLWGYFCGGGAFIGALIGILIGVDVSQRRKPPAKSTPESSSGPDHHAGLQRFACLECGTRLRAKSSASRKVLKCPRCGHVTRLAEG